MDIQYIARPTLFDGALGIGNTLVARFQLAQQHQVMAPQGQLSAKARVCFRLRGENPFM